MRKDKIKAIKLRRQGKNYNEISRLLDVPKSTLSDWFSGVKWSQDLARKLSYNNSRKQAKRMLYYSKLRAKIAKDKRDSIIFNASKEIKTLSGKDLKLIGSMLYWAEGNIKNKNRLQFSNSNALMISIVARFFREICNIPDEKIKARVYIYPGMNYQDVINFWSKTIKLTEKNFCKPQIQVSKASKNKRPRNTLPYGTLHLTVTNTEITCKVKGWIRGIADNYIKR